jgi:hypothetical protein
MTDLKQKNNHMKQIIFFSLFLVPLIGNAQSLERSVIGTAGNSTEALSWTIGEPVVQTVANGTNMLTQGFHQGDLTVTTLIEEQAVDYSVSVHPNPVNTQLTIETDKTDIPYQVMDVNGKVLKTGTIERNTVTINFTGMPKGTYFLQLDNMETHKIIKNVGN